MCARCACDACHRDEFSCIFSVEPPKAIQLCPTAMVAYCTRILFIYYSIFFFFFSLVVVNGLNLRRAHTRLEMHTLNVCDSISRTMCGTFLSCSRHTPSRCHFRVEKICGCQSERFDNHLTPMKMVNQNKETMYMLFPVTLILKPKSLSSFNGCHR